jgi:alpha-1,2-mannosyltransferase
VDNYTPAPFPGLRRWHVLALVALALAVAIFGVVVEVRSAFLTRRMTDLQVYLRAAWAVRAGTDLYAVQDDNHWHYHYPPLFAILLTPLADAPPEAAPLAGRVPFAVSVALWYAISVGCLWVSVHWLARALEETAGRAVPPRWSRRWWTLRTLPLLVCLPAVGSTLIRGQVNLLLMALLCGMVAAALRGQSWRAGFWLAGAVCLKIIPAFLLLWPLWRRDPRWLLGCALGLVVGLWVVPAAVLGPERTLGYFGEWADVLARPALGEGDDQSRAKELLETTATDNQSFGIIVHNTLHIAEALREGKPRRDLGLYFWLTWERIGRPLQPAPATRLAHWLIGGVLTGLTLLASGWRKPESPATLLGLGGLVLLMALLSPVCHLHYFCLTVPLVMGLLWVYWDSPGLGIRRSRLGLGLTLLFGAHLVGSMLPRLPGLELLRDLGVAAYASMLLWLVAVVVLACGRAAAQPRQGSNEETHRALAA